MLQKTIADLSLVDEKYRVLYVQQADGTYQLEDDLFEDVSGLKNNNIKLKQEKLTLKQKLDELEAFKQQQIEKELLEGKKYEQLIQAKTAQYETALEAEKVKVQQLTDNLKRTALTTAVKQIATDLAGENALLLEPHIQARIQANMNDEGAVELQFLGIDGGAINQDGLINEFKQNPVFKTVIKGKRSTGGGAQGGSQGEGDTGEWAQYFDETSDSYSPSKQYELQQTNPQLHDALFAKYLAGKY